MARPPRREAATPRRAAYTRVVFPEFTDEQLENLEFKIDNPLALPSVTDEEPPRDQTITFVGHYTVRDMLKCVFGHHHKTGFVFRDEQGRHFLVGHTCGENVMGVEGWHNVVRAFKDIETRASYIRRVHAMQQVLQANRDWLIALISHPAILAIAWVRSVLAKRVELSRAAHMALLARDGEVERLQRQRNIEKEEQRETREEREITKFKNMSEIEQVRYLRYRPEPRITTDWIYDEVPVVVGKLSGKPLFLRHFAETKMIRDIVQQLERFARLDTMAESTTSLKSGWKQVATLLGYLEEAKEEIQETISFFDQRNLDLIASWANDRRYDNSDYFTKPGSLVIRDERSGRDIEVRRPVELAPLDGTVFAVLRDALRISAAAPAR